MLLFIRYKDCRPLQRVIALLFVTLGAIKPLSAARGSYGYLADESATLNPLVHSERACTCFKE